MEHSPKGEEQEGWGPRAWTLLTTVRQRSPLIQCITNYVSMDLMANTLLSVGASPAMIHSLQEISEFSLHTEALLINVGTLSSDWLPSMKMSAEMATVLGKPWVLDPVAAGATSFRLEACMDLIELKPTVIRGNGSEIIALSKFSVGPSKVNPIWMNDPYCCHCLLLCLLPQFGS